MSTRVIIHRDPRIAHAIAQSSQSRGVNTSVCLTPSSFSRLLSKADELIVISSTESIAHLPWITQALRAPRLIRVHLIMHHDSGATASVRLDPEVLGRCASVTRCTTVSGFLAATVAETSKLGGAWPTAQDGLSHNTRQDNAHATPLSNTERRIVEVLATAGQSGLATGDLAKAVWGEDTASHRNNLRVMIHRVRSKLPAGTTIATERGVGYRLVSSVTADSHH